MKQKCPQPPRRWMHIFTKHTVYVHLRGHSYSLKLHFSVLCIIACRSKLSVRRSGASYQAASQRRLHFGRDGWARVVPLVFLLRPLHLLLLHLAFVKVVGGEWKQYNPYDEHPQHEKSDGGRERLERLVNFLRARPVRVRRAEESAPRDLESLGLHYSRCLKCSSLQIYNRIPIESKSKIFR